ncbi:hypothetical protein [Hugenholtzia roseola]|uniref:hypothetical protein n=1 Tax=Hugenholtzia roseola TaxID=1002 RepID=UPI0003F91D93|nr:hypothetical protein [Hugenholtzia roseola]
MNYKKLNRSLFSRAYFLLAALPFLFLATACPYSSSVPLAPAKDKIAPNLLGKWVEKSSFDNPKFYVITENNPTTYQFEENTYSSSSKTYEKKIYLAHLTPIGKVTFLNLRGDDGKYFFFKLEKAENGQSFILYEVTDNIDETFNSSEELFGFFDKHKELSFFYNKDEATFNKE